MHRLPLVTLGCLLGCLLMAGTPSCLDTTPPQSGAGARTFVSSEADALAEPFSRGMIHAAGEVLGTFMEHVTTDGSLESAALIADGQATMGLVQVDVFAYARDRYLEQFHRDPANAEKRYLAVAAQLRVVMAAYERQVFLLVNSERVPDIDGDGTLTLADLARSSSALSINAGEPDSDTWLTATTVLAAQPFVAQPELTTLAPAAGVNSVVNGFADAAFVVDHHPAAALLAVPASAPVQLVRVFLPAGPGLYGDQGVIEEEAYPFHHERLEDNATVAVVLASGPLLAGRAVDVFVDYVLGHVQDFTAYDPEWARTSADMTRELMLANPQLCHALTLAYLTGQPPLDPFFIAPQFCSGELLGPSHDMAVELIYLLSHNLDVDLREQDTTGSWENSYWLGTGGATLGLVQDDLVDYLVGFGDLDSALQAAALKKLAPLNYEYVHVLVNTQAFGAWGLSGAPFVNGTRYYFRVPTLDTFGAQSAGRRVVATPYAPSAVTPTDLRVTAGNHEIAVGWTDPTDPGVTGVELWYGTGGMPSTLWSGTREDGVATIRGLSNDVEYAILLIVSGGGPVLSEQWVFTSPAAVTATEVSGLTIGVADSHVTLAWTNPPSSTFYLAQVWYSGDGEGYTRYGGHTAASETTVLPNEYLHHLAQLLTDPSPAPFSPRLRVNVGPKTSGTFASAMALLSSYPTVVPAEGSSGSPGMGFVYSFDAPSDAVAKVAAGELDVAFLTSGVPHSRLYGHDTYSLPTNVRLLSALFFDADSDGDYLDGMPEPYRAGVLAGGGVPQFERYPYAASILPFDIVTTRARALLVASPAWDHPQLDEFLKSIYRKAFYMVTPSDPDDPDFMPDPLWVPISLESFSAAESAYDTYGEDVIGAMEYFVQNPFGWSDSAAAYYLSLFPDP